MGNYTLLADENSPYSRQTELLKDFKAHLIYNIILNGDITFSDNQVMSSPNLRHLARVDGNIRTLFKQRRFTLAVRDASVDDDGTVDIRAIFDAFLAEGKIPEGYRNFEDSPELTFIGEHAVPVPWSFAEVRANFTTAVKQIIRNEFSRLLPEAAVDTVFQWIAVEEVRDNGGLGRAFLQNPDRLPAMFERYGLMPLAAAREQLIICTDAVYLSNLPKTIGLNPIYAQQHRASFNLLRNFDQAFEPMGEATRLKERLDWEHLREGLNRMTIDDVEWLQDSPAFRDYQRLSKSDRILDDFDMLEQVYCELNILIEDRIIQRSPELARSSPQPTPRQIRAKYSTAVEKGQTLIGDSVALCMEIAGTASDTVIPFGGLLTDLVFDPIKSSVMDKIAPERPHFDIANHQRQMKKLRRLLEDRGKGDVVKFEEEFVSTSSFDKEIIVR